MFRLIACGVALLGFIVAAEGRGLPSPPHGPTGANPSHQGKPSPEPKDCFTGTSDQVRENIFGSGSEATPEYMLGIDRILEPIAVRFFPSGLVCGWHPFLGIRIEGRNVSDGKLQLHFLKIKTEEDYSSSNQSEASPNEVSDDLTDEDRKELKEAELDKQARTEKLNSIFGNGLFGNAIKTLTSDLIMWEGAAKKADGREFSFYLKRVREKALEAPPASKDYCGDGGCDPLEFVVAVKQGSESKLLDYSKKLPVTRIAKVGDKNECPEFELKEKLTCFVGVAWHFEEGDVVRALKKKPYVVFARRTGGGAGMDTETLFLDSDQLISRNLRLNLPVAVPLFQDALTKYFEGTGLDVGEPISKQNALFWEFKGRRFQFEKNTNPSPSDKSEWWKIRLQIGITEGNAGTYILTVGMPETRVFLWALDAPPNDAKFTTELTNDERFADLQGRLIVALTKNVAAHKNLP